MTFLHRVVSSLAGGVTGGILHTSTKIVINFGVMVIMITFVTCVVFFGVKWCLSKASRRSIRVGGTALELVGEDRNHQRANQERKTN